MVKDTCRNKKRYLTGIDWFVQVFDYMNKKLTGNGHVFQIVIELDGHIDDKGFVENLEQFVSKFTILSGKTARALNLAPYWKVSHRSSDISLSTRTSYVNSEAEIFSCLESKANSFLKQENVHLSCHFIFYKSTSFISLTLDHRVFDGLGGELFLNAFQEFLNDKSHYQHSMNFSMPAQLSRWREKFEAGRVVNRAFLKMTGMKPPRAIPIPYQKNNKFRFKVITFSQKESKEIINKADKDAGYLLLMPYLLANTIMLMSKIFANHGSKQGALIVPVTIDMRQVEKKAQEMFFNHLSFLFFKIKPDEILSSSVLIGTIKQQLYDQVKESFPEKFSEMALLMRILPVSLLGKVMRLYMKKQMISFSFSYLGNSAYTHAGLSNKRIKNMFHMPQAPIPPGLGVFFHQFDGKLNATVSYLEGLLTDRDLDIITNTLKALPLRKDD